MCAQILGVGHLTLGLLVFENANTGHMAKRDVTSVVSAPPQQPQVAALLNEGAQRIYG